MATDAEVAAQINAALAPQERPASEQELHDFPWLRRGTDQTPTDQEQPTQQELHDFPWLARQQQQQPQAQPQAKPTVSDDVLQSVVDAYNKTRSPLEWAEDVIKGSPLSAIPKTGIQMAEVGLKEAGKDIAGIGAAAMRTAAPVVAAGGAAEAAFVGGVQLPNLQGMPVAQVKQVRERMLAQKTDLEARKDKIIDSGTPDEYGLYGFLQATQGLDQRIKDADAIIASGKPQAGPSGTTEPLARGLNYGGRTLAPAVSGFLDKYVPTSQEFENSLPGQIARYGADGLVLGGVEALTGPIGGSVAGGLMMGNQKYDEAKALGASDEVADRVSLITSAVTGASMLALGPVVGGLAKSFAGLTAKQGMNALVQAGAYTGTRVIGGGAEFGVFNLEQNAIDKLSGYDPNRKLDEGFWQNFWTGAVFGAVHVATSDIPHIARMFKPDTTVRNKDGTPAQTGEQTQAPPTTTPGAPPTPTVQQQAEAAARATATGTPEQVIAQADPAAELHRFIAMEGQPGQPRGFVQVGGTPPVYTGPARPAPAETRLLAGPRDAAAMPPAATEHGAEPVPSNTPGPPTTVPAPQAAGERITAAAVRQGNVIGLGVNHADAIDDLNAKGGKLSDEQVSRYYQTGTQEGAEYGFITSSGRFVDREEAQRISGAKGAEAIHMLPQEAAAAPAADIGTRILNAYNEVRAETKRPYVYIHDVLERAGVPEDQAKEWIRNNGQIQLAEGDWGAARTEAERRGLPADRLNQAGVELQGRNRILMDASGAAEPARPARFVPSTEWQDVPEGLALPPGGEYKINVSTGARQARWAKPPGPETVVDLRAGVPEAPTAQRRAWYEKEDLANLPPVARPEPEDRAIGPADVKREVNTAQEQMGMEDHLHYVANVEALPAHVKAGLTEGERSNTAQIVRDNKLGNIYVIGDRFDSLNDLRRKIVEETLPYHYRNITKVGLTHDNTDPRTGHYDILADRPILNTHAIISQDRPYEEAARALMEEADVHQGISKLLGPRNGPVYTQVMGQLIQNFQRLGLVDKLAQLRGYDNAQAMAQAYGVPKWNSDPRQANKFTEELAAGWSRNFRNADELMRDGPSWWQNGLRQLNNGIRQFMGIRLSDYDVQSLLVDSAAALRRAKWDDHEAQFHGIGEEAKSDMREFQMATLPPEPTATEAGETADIGTELVKAQARRLQANLRPGQFIREQNLARAMDETHGLQERLNLLRANDAVENEEGHRAVMQAANRVFGEEFNGNVDVALQHLIDDEMRPGAAVPAFNEVVDRNTDRRIVELQAAGLTDEANLLRARLDRMGQIQGRLTTEVARQLSAERLRHETGTTAVARSKNDTQDAQRQEIEKPTQVNNKRKVDTGLDKVKEATEAAAGSLKEKVQKAMAQKPSYRRIGPGWGLREQHVQDLVDRIDDAVSKQGDVAQEDKGGLAQVYDSFRKTLLQIINERKEPPEEREAKPISAMSTLRDIMSNYPAYEEAWKRTMDMLQTKDTALAQRFSSAIEEPVGETLANKLAAEQGVDLSDLIYNHYSTTDRINTDLATKIAQAATEGRLGPGQEWLANLQNAQGLTGHLQRVFKDIVDKEQKAKLQSILESVGATHKPTPNELDQLLNHIAIGGLNNAEWLNLVGPRFGIEGYTPEKLDALRAAGDYMSRLRDEGLDSSAIAQKTRSQIAYLTQLNDDPWLTKQYKYLNDVYASALLTGPMTHIPYWQQGLISNAMDVTIQGIRDTIKAKDPSIMLRALPKAMAGYIRGMGEFPAIFHGIKPSETFFPEAPGTPRPPGPMEATPERPFSKFRYVRNTLEGVANLMAKGPAYAVHYANMRALLEENENLSPQEAHDAASEVVLGSKAEQDQATKDAQDIAERYGLDKYQQKMLRGELLDQYKTNRDPADSSLANTTSEELRDVATRAFDTAMGGTLRGNVRGTAGWVSRGLLSFANRFPWFRPFAEFLKIPFNAVNEYMAWTPLGVFRSARNLVPADWPVLGRAVAELPFTRGGVESYLGKTLEKQIESGEFSQEHIQDIAWNQMAKGLVGTTVGGFLMGVVRSLLGNPNPPIRFTYQGPSQYGQQEVERGKGWQPRSIKIGDAWHSYENTPWRALFAAVGAYEDYFRYEKQNPDTASNEGIAGWRALAGGLTSVLGSPLQGLDALLNYFTQFGGQGAQREIGNFATQMVGSMLTAPLGGTATRQLYRTFVDQNEYEGNSLWEKSMRYIPVVNAMNLQPKLNVFGEHMHSTPLKAFFEYGNKIDNNDPVWEYLDKHPGIKLSMPGNQGSPGGIKMTPAEVYQYHLARGPALKEQIARAIASPGFRAMPVDEQNLIVHRTFEKVANRYGQAAVMRYRQQNPVTPERRAASRVGQLEAIMKEAESTRLPEEASAE